MAIARFKDLCLDAGDPAVVGAFWASVLGRTFEAKDNGDAVLLGPTKQHAIWINGVPEPKGSKYRVHLDVYTRALSDLEELGAQVVLAADESRRWTVMADPEGAEFCAFLRDELPEEILHGLVVDCADHHGLAEWWGNVYDAEVVHHESGYSTVQHIPAMPIETMDFVPVPEAKSGKNRVHWDVAVTEVGPLLEAGATELRPPDNDIDWHVMADPEGNEFCAFIRPNAGG